VRELYDSTVSLHRNPCLATVEDARVAYHQGNASDCGWTLFRAVAGI